MSYRILVLSDAHFYNPQYYQHVVKGDSQAEPPSRLSTDLALGDPKANSFHALIQLARERHIVADALVCCGDLTMCADPTAMNLGWLQLQRLASALGCGEPIVTIGNHDIDSRFTSSATNPQRALRLLDPPYPTADKSAAISYWAHGYCIIDRPPLARIVIVNTCSLHGYESEKDRHLDHGFVPEQLFEQLPDELSSRDQAHTNILICHHHPAEINLPAEDRSVISNGTELLDFLTKLSAQPWLVLHGHRHMPSVRYASSALNSPVIFSAGSFSVNLHLELQGRASNQFYVLDVEGGDPCLRGTYEAWTWDQYEGEWCRGQDSRALPSCGGFGYRPDPKEAVSMIEPLVPKREAGSLTWREIEDTLCDFRYLLPQDRSLILNALTSQGLDWESDSGRPDTPSASIRIGRSS